MKIKSKVEGKVGKIKVKVGDVVSMDDVICIVENGKLTRGEYFDELLKQLAKT